ncbi:MAG: hypothetical protein N2235_02145 [Fischerella sp.]|nr:hypothetical protein [Fischerella sp.]
MNKIFYASTKLLAAVCGGLMIGVSAIPQVVMAQQQPTTSLSKVNPCPGIFYEEPHNNRVLVPEGCPPNAFTQRQITQGISPRETVPGTPSVTVIQPPLPEKQFDPVATITPSNGRVDVRLKNNTNAAIAYQAIGHTGQRVLPGRQEVVLQDLPVAVTITAVRQDGGFLRITPISSESGLLELALDETTEFRNSQTAIRIQQDGQVYLN